MFVVHKSGIEKDRQNDKDRWTFRINPKGDWEWWYEDSARWEFAYLKPRANDIVVTYQSTWAEPYKGMEAEEEFPADLDLE